MTKKKMRERERESEREGKKETVFVYSVILKGNLKKIFKRQSVKCKGERERWREGEGKREIHPKCLRIGEGKRERVRERR